MERNIENIASCLSKEMSDFENAFRRCFSAEDALLNSVLTYASSLKGKRLRPLLTFLVAKTFGNLTLQTMRSAVIIELLHTASLLHDDVIDDSLLRRNNSTVNALFGDKAAILTGDFLYGKALATIKTNEDFMLMDVFSRIAIQLPQGEMKETDVTQNKNTDIEHYLQVIYYKTASLVSAATECGARTCQNQSINVKELASLGENIGMAFQIRDDVLDYDTDNKMGKGIGNDIRERKITLPFIYCLQSLNGKDKEEFEERFFAENKSQADIDCILRTVNESDAVEKSVQMQTEYSNKALKIVDNMPLNDYSVALRELVWFLTTRNK